jgi:hypothetical protein
MLSRDCAGRQVYRMEDAVVWCSRNRSTGEIYVALFNLSEEKAEISVSGAAVAETLGLQALPVKKKLYELWEKTTDEGQETDIRACVAPHGVKAYRLTED